MRLHKKTDLQVMRKGRMKQIPQIALFAGLGRQGEDFRYFKDELGIDIPQFYNEYNLELIIRQIIRQ